MKRFPRLFRVWLVAAVCAMVVAMAGESPGAGPTGVDVARLLSSARPGSTVTLPAGILKAGDLAVPPGVNLRGAGYEKTILQADGHACGVICRGEGSRAISDLSVSGAQQTGILVDEGAKVSVERVRVRKCMNGLIVRNAAECRLGNVVSADNRVGAIFTGTRGCRLVNATLANNAATALVLAGNEGLTAFNNLLVGSQLGVSCVGENTNIVLDHNVYVCHFAGRVPGQVIRKKVESWRDLTGYDRHSLLIPVEFAAPEDGNYRPASRLTWAPTRPTTADWGAEELAGVGAPQTDIDGRARIGGVDVGAYEAAFPAPREPDGTFTVQSAEGVTSAGLYTKDGVNVRFLFQNLPLAKGTYQYWLPSRDWQGRPIPAGEYQLRITEANLRLEYIAAAGNGDLDWSLRQPNDVRIRASVSPHTVVFGAEDRLILAQHGFENGIHVRGYDRQMSRLLWAVRGEGNAVGSAADHRGRVYVFRRPASLLRLDAATGQGVPFANGSFEKSYPDAFAEPSGMTALGDRLFVADAKAGKLVVLAGDGLEVAGSLAVPAPSQPAADVANKLIWVISDGKELLAFDETGQVRHRAAPVEEPKLLSVSAGRMAVYSAASNQIAVLDCSNPAQLKPMAVRGRSGSRFGKIDPEKLFKPRWIALDSGGNLAVADPPRVILLSASGGGGGAQQMAMWGQGITWGRFANDDRAQFFNIGGGHHISIDPKNRRWEPGSFWEYTVRDYPPMCFFNAGGKNYGLFLDKHASLVVMGMEADGTARPLVRYGYAKTGLFRQCDTNGDGKIEDPDTAVPVLDKDGKPITQRLLEGRAGSGVDPRVDGALVIPLRHAAVVVPLRGIDPQGVPEYDFAHRRVTPALVEGQSDYISPYDFQTRERVSIAEDWSYFDDGSFTAAISTKSGAGPDLCTEHANATAMAGFDSKGNLRWFSAMNPVGLKMGFYGITTIGGVTFAGRGAICEYETMDRDGLGTGTLGTPREFAWTGMWLDNHRQTQGLTGNDGQPYLIVGDYCCQAYHWLALKGHDRIQRQTLRVRISDAMAASLEAQAPQPVPPWPVPAPPGIVIRRLAQPLKVDGDAEKWRKLGIAPQIILTPDTGGDGPKDSSAVIRLAYFGDQLYIHAIRFDDVVTMHNPLAKFFRHDALEICINTYPDGFKYNITRTADKGEVVWRDTWRAGWDRKRTLNQLLPPEVSPRVIKVLPNSRDIEDRKLIEAAYGIDMSDCRAIVYEVMIPQSAMQPIDHKDLQVEFGSGKEFRLGIMIDDNDVPGSDDWQNTVWPVTFGIFERSERSATAKFE